MDNQVHAQRDSGRATAFNPAEMQRSHGGSYLSI
jgi:hypothetical protein